MKENILKMIFKSSNIETLINIGLSILFLIGLIKILITIYKSDKSILKKLFYLFIVIFLFKDDSYIIPIFIFIPIGLVFSVKLIIKNIFNKNKKTNKKKQKAVLNDEDSFYLQSDIGTIQIANPYRGILIEGGAGSGKSASIFYPIISQSMQKNYSGLCYDFKSPELSQFTNAMHTKFNSKVKFAFLNFKDYQTSCRINPIAPRYVSKQAIAFEISNVLINNLLPENIKKPDYWSRSSISIVAGAIWYLRNNHPEHCTLPHLIAMLLFYSSSELIGLISTDIECIGMISSIKEAYDMNAEKQLSGVVGTIKNALSQLNFPELFHILSEDNINLDLNNPTEPTFLSIGNDSTLSTTFAPIISLVISVCLRKMNEPNKSKSVVLLDEAPTLYIPNLEQIPATARSNKICTIVGLQDYSQMVDKYGQDKAQVLISNLGNQFYGRTVNERTAKMITALFGKEDKEYTSTSKGTGSSEKGFLDTSFSRNSSTSKSYQERDRIKVSDITNLRAGKFYGLIAQGNHKELMGVQLEQTQTDYLNFNKSENIDVSETFKKIYEEVKSFNQKTKKIVETDFNINLNI